MDWIFVGRPKAGGREYYHQLLAIEAPSIWGDAPGSVPNALSRLVGFVIA